MTIQLIKAPNPILNEMCEEVDPTSPETHQIVRDLAETLAITGGQGLAAPQIGATKRVFIMIHDKKYLVAMCNPVIVRRGKELTTEVEGCLSMPGYRVEMERNMIITVQWTDPDGTNQEAKMRGNNARIIQHELDHLNGVLIGEKTDG